MLLAVISKQLTRFFRSKRSLAYLSWHHYFYVCDIWYFFPFICYFYNVLTVFISKQNTGHQLNNIKLFVHCLLFSENCGGSSSRLSHRIDRRSFIVCNYGFLRLICICYRLKLSCCNKQLLLYFNFMEKRRENR